jgi:hypothetical protein
MVVISAKRNLGLLFVELGRYDLIMVSRQLDMDIEESR